MRLNMFAATVASLFAFATATNMTTYRHFDCGVDISKASRHFNQTVRAMHSGHFAAHNGASKAGLMIRSSTPITVDVAFHIITSSSKSGSITPSMATAQLATLNKAYLPSNVQFNLINTTFTVNDAWAAGASPDDVALKTALRQGTYKTLNVYFMTDLTGNILGTCSLPSDIGPGTPAPSTYLTDGCMIQANTMPGGNILGFSQGMTTVHEVGHWMGLLHTFEGYSCTGTGDFVADTPVQSTSTDGCPRKPAKDSCPGQAGVDAVWNYMDYSDDACYTGFTQGQTDRMGSMWATYRQGH